MVQKCHPQGVRGVHGALGSSGCALAEGKIMVLDQGHLRVPERVAADGDGRLDLPFPGRGEQLVHPARLTLMLSDGSPCGIRCAGFIG